jgi:MscS family membrane protein
VYFNEFADFSLNILLYVFHEAPDWPTELRERHRLFTDILRLARRLGIEFAFPTQTLHIASTPDTASDANLMPGKDRGGREAALAGEAGLSAAAMFGRQEAEALIRELWGSGTQQPVSFNNPASMGPARENSGEHDTPQQ